MFWVATDYYYISTTYSALNFCILDAIVTGFFHENSSHNITSLLFHLFDQYFVCGTARIFWRRVAPLFRLVTQKLSSLHWGWRTTNPLLSSKLILKALCSYKTQVPCQCNALLWGFVWVNKMEQRRWKNNHRASRGSHSHIWGKGIGT